MEYHRVSDSYVGRDPDGRATNAREELLENRQHKKKPADAVQQLGPSRIFISPHPEERIALNGDVVWADRSKKTGALRFIDLGADSSNRIRDWLKQAGQPGVSHEHQEYPVPSWAVQELPDIPPGSSKLDTSPIPRLRTPVRGRRPVEPRLARV